MKIFNIFKNKKEEYKPITKKKFILDDTSNVEKFNYWFCHEYEGYDGRKGAIGIFKRLDKLSPNMIEDWFNHLNVDYEFTDISRMIYLIRLNWRN